VREKPIYTLDDFFRVQMTVTLAGKRITVRTLSDVELQSASRAGSLARKERRQDLETEGNEERETWRASLRMTGRDDILASIKGYKAVEFENNLRMQRPFVSLTMPDNPSRKEEEGVLAEREEARKQYDADILKQTQAAVEAEIARLAEQPDEVAQEMLDGYLLDSQIIMAFNAAYNRRLLFYACSINGKPMFTSPDAVANLNPEAMDRLLKAYIEVRGVDLDTLEDFFETASSTDGASP
jgi:hypothetical protein